MTVQAIPPLTHVAYNVFGAYQYAGDPLSHVYGIGIDPVFRDTAPRPMEFDSIAYMGTLELPTGTSFADFQWQFEVQLFNADGSIGDWTVPQVRFATIPEPTRLSLSSLALVAAGVTLRFRRSPVKP